MSVYTAHNAMQSFAWTHPIREIFAFSISCAGRECWEAALRATIVYHRIELVPARKFQYARMTTLERPHVDL